MELHVLWQTYPNIGYSGYIRLILIIGYTKYRNIIILSSDDRFSDAFY